METENTTKIARPKPETDADDRLSSLPDEIISHILSFLQTKYAVGTAVLSRRWKDLWARVSSLDLDYGLVYKPLNMSILIRTLPPDEQLKYRGGKLPVPDPLSGILARRELEFCRFVDRVLSQHKNLGSLRRIRFFFPTALHRRDHFSTALHRRNQASPDLWFERELVFGPLLEQIEVIIDGETKFGIPQCMRSLPRSFYTLNKLTSVKLCGVILNAAEETVFLPSVKILQLYSVVIEDFNSLGTLISGCPVLETAHLEDCFPSRRNENDVLCVSLPFLKSLRICDYEDSYDDYDNYADTMCALVIEAPKLEDLYFDVATNLHFIGSPFPCLHSAYAAIGDRGSWGHSLIRFLTRISYAKEIILYDAFQGHLSYVKDVQLPDFPNLTHLTIETCGSSWVLHSLLNSASKLQSLVLDMAEGNDGGAMIWDQRFEPDLAPECLLSSLEEIEIKGFVADQDQMEMIAYLLAAGAVLKKLDMHIGYRNSYSDMGFHKYLTSLLKLPRRSSSCEARVLLPNNMQLLIESDHETDIDDDSDDMDDNLDDDLDDMDHETDIDDDSDDIDDNLDDIDDDLDDMDDDLDDIDDDTGKEVDVNEVRVL